MIRYWQHYAQAGAMALAASDPKVAQRLVEVVALTVLMEALAIQFGLGMLPAPVVF